LLRRLAGVLAGSPLLARGRDLMAHNWTDFEMPLSKWGKLAAGSYLILKDYADGRFPPRFEDQAAAYAAEQAYFSAIPGTTRAEAIARHCVKPFWGSAEFDEWIAGFTTLLRTFEDIGLRSGQRILELGCGDGWMAEFLALSGYDVTGTTISPDDVEIGATRVAALRQRGLPERLRFVEAPMETVDESLGRGADYDAAFVFEALHHAFDWRRAIHASGRCLKPGGWLVIGNEPNIIHTFVSYRVARLTNTHEIGMSRGELVDEMRRAGFQEVRPLRPRFDDRIRSHWIVARK
jgi:SAM-dependent methyltransferase